MYEQFIYFVGLLLIIASYTDLRWMKIPNIIPVMICGVFLIEYVLAPAQLMPVMPRLISAAALFVITFGLFAANILGAGDSKLLAALGLWIPLNALTLFIFFMALFGAALSAFSYIVLKTKCLTFMREGSVWMSRLHEGQGAVPYGVAIAFGYVMLLYKGLI